jgi:ligand-binding SRPBCC domain-containing protein
MATIELCTHIAAPRERCFDLARSVELHLRSTAKTNERAVAGVTRGLIGDGQEVTWEARHFGLRQRFTSRISAYDRPRSFQDSMVRGAFARFVHDHVFDEDGAGGTTMIDRLDFAAPLGPLGRLVDRLLLSSYLERFLVERNALIKRVAESAGEWRTFV